VPPKTTSEAVATPDAAPSRVVVCSRQIVLLSDFCIRDEDAVRYATSRSNVVVNCVGQRSESMNYSYNDVHNKWPAMLAK
jgi:hypothetical protein